MGVSEPTTGQQVTSRLVSERCPGAARVLPVMLPLFSLALFACGSPSWLAPQGLPRSGIRD